MNYYSVGLKDDNLIKIFNELKIVLEYTSKYLKSYPPYTFTEVSTTGYIVSACGRLNFAAVQEYRTTSKIDGKINYGRGDLCVFVNDNKAYRVEAKQFLGWPVGDSNNYPHIREKREKNLRQIEAYKGMMLQKGVKDDYISLMYVVPPIDEGQYQNNAQLAKDWGKFIDSLREEYPEKTSFIVSYSNDLDSLNFIYDKKGKINTAWPGLAIIGDIIKS